MMASQESPREQPSFNHSRRSNGENLQGRLHASSFPHRVFAEVGKHLVDRLVTTGNQDVNDVYAQLLAEEEHFSALDYIRFVEIRRDQDHVTLTVKRLLLDEHTTMVRDARDTHEVLCAVTFDVEGGPDLAAMNALIDYLVDIYYHTVTPRRYQTGLDAVLWKADTRITATSRPRQGASSSTRGTSVHLDTREVKEMLQHSLNKSRFHIAMTPRCIQLFDQSKAVSVR